MGNEQETKQLFKGALLLTLAAFFSKILSAGYRIPLQNITGDLGFYIYQQVYPFLGMALMISLYGFPSAISKLVAEQNEEGHKLSLPSFYLPIFSLLFSISFILFLVIYLNAAAIAGLMGDHQLLLPLRVTAIAFLFIPFPALFRGIFQGMNNMKPTAISQVIEQIVRVSIILISAVILVGEGKNLYQIGAGAAFGSLVGALAAAILLGVIWLKHHPFHMQTHPFTWKTYTKPIGFFGLYMCLNHMLLLLLQFADAFTLVPGLREYGYELAEAKIWKGVFDRGQPLIQLGTVLGSSLALALVPSVTKKRLEQKPTQFRFHIQSAMKTSVFISIGAAAGLICIFPYVNTLLFQNNAGTHSLRLLALAILFAPLAITTSTILQGLGHIRITALYILIGLVVKWVLNGSLIPYYGISGSALATVASVCIVLGLNAARLKKALPDAQLFALVRWKALLLSVSAMVFYLVVLITAETKFIHLSSRTNYLWFVLLLAGTGALLYFILLIRLKAFEERELQVLPFGEQLSYIQKRR